MAKLIDVDFRDHFHRSNFCTFSKGRGMNCKDCEANNFKNHKCILYTKSENYDEKRSAFYKL